MIASDMDGTLLDNNSEISDGNIAAIRKAVDCGVKFVLATGRPIMGVRNYLSLLDLKTPVITYNGAVVADPVTDEILFEQNMRGDDAALAMELGQMYDTTMCIWSKGQLYVNKLNERAYDYMKISGVEPVLIDDLSAFATDNITKILWYDSPEMIGKMPREMEAKPFLETSFCLSRPYFLEFFSSKVSKAAALKRLCELYGILPEEVIAVGDAPNDLSMIEFAGLGVAMGNAHDEVKAAAKYVTASNDEDGVAVVIDEFVLK